MSDSIVRYDLDKCYRYNEYNGAIAYAKKNINVEGVREQVQSLKNEAEIYEQDIKNIIDPEREAEDKKYLVWEKWNTIKNICRVILGCLAGGTVICWILGMVWSSVFSTFGILGLFSSLVMFLVFAVIKVVESIYGYIYNKYVNRIMRKVDARNAIFNQEAHQYYEQIDRLYLQSLDPAHREMILMHREQIEHNKEMKRLEMNRQMVENERLQEQRRTRKAQERLVEIEEEKERRRRGY